MIRLAVDAVDDDHVTLTARSVVAGSVLLLKGREYSPLILAVGAGAN
jgi:hypothetical protein